MPSRAADQTNTNKKHRIIMLITANIDDIRCLECVDMFSLFFVVVMVLIDYFDVYSKNSINESNFLFIF